MAKTVKPAGNKKRAAKKPVEQPAKKTASKKTAGSTTETGIKYADKSAGQPKLVPIFNAIKNLLLPYEKGSIQVRGGDGGQIVLVSNKPAEIAGKKKDEVWFAAALVQKGYVGFYFMPVDTKLEIKELFEPELLKCLKGKSCFHIKKHDPEIYAQIAAALAKGYRLYREKGWL